MPEPNNKIENINQPIVSENQENNPEKLLEELGPVLDGLNQIENSIFEEGMDFIDKSGGKDGRSAEKMQQLLDSLQAESFKFFKKVSKELSHYPLQVVGRLRDGYINRVTHRLNTKLSKEDNLNAYYFRRKSKELQHSAGEVEDAANHSFDKIMREAEGVLKMLEGKYWGQSNKGREAFQNVNLWLLELSSHASILDRQEDVTRLMNCLQKCIEVRPDVPNQLHKITEKVVGNADSNHGLFGNYNASQGQSNDRIKEIFNSNPFLILQYLQKLPSNEQYQRSDLMLEQIDKLVADHQATTLPGNFIQMFSEALSIDPERYIRDPEKRAYFFETFKFGVYNGGSTTVFPTGYFGKEFSNITKREKDKFLNKLQSTYGFSDRLSKISSFLPLDDKDLKDIYPAQSNIDTSSSGVANYIDSLGSSVSFFFYEKLGLSPSQRIELLKYEVKANRSEKFAFLNRLSCSFDQAVAGLDPGEVEKCLTSIFDHVAESMEIEDFQELIQVFEYNNFPKTYQDKLVKTFMVQNNRSRELGEIVNPNDGSSAAVKWAHDRPDIYPEIEKAFYRHGNFDDLRHFFFQVLDGREVIDLDLLVESYAKRINSFVSEDFIQLFLVDKKIDKKYVKFFAPLSYSISTPLKEALDLGRISQEDYDWTAQSFIKYGGVSAAKEFFAHCFDYIDNQKNDINNPQYQELRADLLTSYGEARAGELRNRSYMNSVLGDGIGSYLRPEEEKILLRSFFNKALDDQADHGQLGDYLSECHRDFFLAFDADERQEYFKKVCFSPNHNAIFTMAGYYVGSFTTADFSEIFSRFSEKEKSDFVHHAFSFRNYPIYELFARAYGGLPETERQWLADSLEENEKPENFDKRDQSEYDHFVNAVLYDLKNGEELATIEERERSREIIPLAKQIITRALAGNLSPGISQSIFEYRHQVIDLGDGLFDQYVEKSLEAGGLRLEFVAALGPLGSNVLSTEQIKTFSQKILEEQGPNVEIYNFYLEHGVNQESPSFYFDQSSFDLYSRDNDKGLKNRFQLLKLQREQDGREGIIRCTPEQEQALMARIISANGGESMIRELISFDADLFRQALLAKIKDRTLDWPPLNDLLAVGGDVVLPIADEIIEYTFSHNCRYVFPRLCQCYGSNPELLTKIKKRVNADEASSRLELRTILLQNDLLDTSELKEMYQDIRQSESPRQQVLANAEVFGSLVASGQLEKVSVFFDGQDLEAEAIVRDMAAFVNRYPLENKGRTVLVMLFAKEYLPELSPEEIVKKVGRSLARYEKVLNNFEYNNIPDGVKTSIGMEYEITRSTADAYKELTGGDLAVDISRLSQAAHIGAGRDAVHEIATRPTVNPYLLLLEMDLLNDIEYVDFNFERSPLYQKGARGFHLTIGGEKGIEVNANTNFLQNLILTASWGGVQAGELNKRVSGGRGVTLRGRSADAGNNIKIFDQPTSSTELRSLSIDKMESFQRALLTAYHGGVAIQTFEKYGDMLPYAVLEESQRYDNRQEFIKDLADRAISRADGDRRVGEIVACWAEMILNTEDALEYHNNNFLEGESSGYLDESGVWVGTEDFGGEYNRKRFEAVVSSIDPTLSVEEYVKSMQIDRKNFYASFDVEFSNRLTKLNNFYLKPSTVSREVSAEGQERTKKIFGGDQANAVSMLENTKIDYATPEGLDAKIYLKNSAFDLSGEKRRGYYYLQGGSEKMLTHAVQKALLEFNQKMERILNRPESN